MKTFRCYIEFGVMLSLIVCLSACTGQKSDQLSGEAEKPNILLIVSEDMGPDLGVYGVKEVATPNLDKLAQKGTRFENAFVTYSVCSPSRSTIFTGLYPHQNGQIGLSTHKYRMYRSFKTLPVYLKEGGYRTGVLGKIHINPENAAELDFHPIQAGNFEKENLSQYAEKAAEFINLNDSSFFLMVNFPDAHWPFQTQVEGMPENIVNKDDIDSTIPFVGVDSRRLRTYTADYYNSINRLDEAVGMLLNSLSASGEENNTLIIFLADHGPQFSRGKFSVLEAGLKVPLIISWPEAFENSQGHVKNELVSSIDIVPTILNAAQVEIPEELPGRSLLPLINKANGTWRKYVFAEGTGASATLYYPRRSVRDQRYKLIHNLIYERENPAYQYWLDFPSGANVDEIGNAPEAVRQAYNNWRNPPEYELYDLQNDPFEFKNLSDDPAYAEELKRLRNALEQWKEETSDPLANPDILVQLANEMDSVIQRYPDYSYRNDPDFQWSYPEYLNN